MMTQRLLRLATGLLAALGAAAAPAAPSNAGLKPTRLEAYGKTHYYQLATEPVVGTMVRCPPLPGPAWGAAVCRRFANRRWCVGERCWDRLLGAHMWAA